MSIFVSFKTNTVADFLRVTVKDSSGITVATQNVPNGSDDPTEFDVPGTGPWTVSGMCMLSLISLEELVVYKNTYIDVQDPIYSVGIFPNNEYFNYELDVTIPDFESYNYSKGDPMPAIPDEMAKYINFDNYTKIPVQFPMPIVKCGKCSYWFAWIDGENYPIEDTPVAIILAFDGNQKFLKAWNVPGAMNISKVSIDCENQLVTMTGFNSNVVNIGTCVLFLKNSE